MAINWFPGHMHKARNQILETFKHIDLVVEVLDARLPYSSMNPFINERLNKKPIIRVLNKSDLADTSITQSWIEYWADQDVKSMALVAEDKKDVQRLMRLCLKLAQQKLNRTESVRVLVAGIPNVGKSTLINQLTGRYVAKTGDEPAVTKKQQMIDLKNGLILADTPGILWPKIENQPSAYRLAISGAIKNTAIEYEDIALYLLDYLLSAYPQELTTRFKLKTLPETALGALEQIGQKRGCLRAGASIDLHKAAEICLHEFRAAKIGQISLETPEMINKELIILAQEQQAKREQEEARKQAQQKGKREHD